MARKNNSNLFGSRSNGANHEAESETAGAGHPNIQTVPVINHIAHHEPVGICPTNCPNFLKEFCPFEFCAPALSIEKELHQQGDESRNSQEPYQLFQSSPRQIHNIPHAQWNHIQYNNHPNQILELAQQARYYLTPTPEGLVVEVITLHIPHQSYPAVTLPPTRPHLCCHNPNYLKAAEKQARQIVRDVYEPYQRAFAELAEDNCRDIDSPVFSGKHKCADCTEDLYSYSDSSSDDDAHEDCNDFTLGSISPRSRPKRNPRKKSQSTSRKRKSNSISRLTDKSKRKTKLKRCNKLKPK